MDAIRAYDTSDSDSDSEHNAQQVADRSVAAGKDLHRLQDNTERGNTYLSSSNEGVSAQIPNTDYSWKEQETHRTENSTFQDLSGRGTGSQYVDHRHPPGLSDHNAHSENHWQGHAGGEATTRDVYGNASRPMPSSDHVGKIGLLPPPPWPEQARNTEPLQEGYGNVGRKGSNYWQQYPKAVHPDFDYSVPPPPLPFPPPSKPPTHQINSPVEQVVDTRHAELTTAWPPQNMQQQGPKKRSRESRWGPEANQYDTIPSENTVSQDVSNDSERQWNQWGHDANQLNKVPSEFIGQHDRSTESGRPWTRGGGNEHPKFHEPVNTDPFPVEPYIPKRLRTQMDQSNNEQTNYNELQTSPTMGQFENGRNSHFEQHSQPPPLFEQKRTWQESTQFSKKLMITPPPVSSAMNQEVIDRLPVRNIVTFTEHTAAVNHVRWNVHQYSHLLASASMDKTVKVWDAVTSKKCVQTLSQHSTGIKDVQWNHSGDHLLSCGFDKTARLCHVETGQEVLCSQHPSYVTCVRFHPDQPNVFISGTYQSSILCWDTRTNKIIKEYKGQFGQVLDLMFLANGMEFLSSTDIVSRDSSDRTIIAWDFRTTAVLSNQIYHEKYTCPTLKSHPYDDVFVAQTNGDYIAYFSSVRPYKMNKHKRCDGHCVSGYQIGCDFSPHGGMLISGSSDGKMYFYDYKSGRRIHVMECHQEACTDVAFHPLFSAMIATCSWAGAVSLWQ